MRLLLISGTLLLAWMLVGASANAELKSGLQVGELVPPFKVIKKGGCDDGVALDESLCYR